MTVKWSDIQSEYEKEAKGFRTRVVEIFLKYEGLDTDEKNRGKTVKVTVASFARHMGIAPRTFADWVEKARNANTALRVPDSPADLPSLDVVEDEFPPSPQDLAAARAMLADLEVLSKRYQRSARKGVHGMSEEEQERWRFAVRALAIPVIHDLKLNPIR